MRFPKPFFRASKDAWYVQLGKRQISLGKDRDEEFERYRVLLLQERGENPEPAFRRLTVAQVFDLFLEWSNRHNEAKTYEWYQNFLQDFSDMYGALEATKLKPFNVTRWLDSHRSWGEASRRCATIAVKRAFNWADAEGILTPNPLKHVKKGPPKRRERILTADERQQILKAARGRAFREFVQALQETGCRPSEVGKVEAANVDLAAGLWVLPEHKTKKKTGKPRLVYLTPAMLELNVPYILEFFVSSAGDAEGKVYVGKLTVTPTSTGTQSFTFTTSTTAASSTTLITATLTDASGDTSAFSSSVTS
jgi:hypothetical protein